MFPDGPVGEFHADSHYGGSVELDAGVGVVDGGRVVVAIAADGKNRQASDRSELGEMALHSACGMAVDWVRAVVH